MERVTFLIEDTHERIPALLNPATVVLRRSAVLRERRSLPQGPAGAAGHFDHGPVVTGGGVTEMELDLLFDTSLAGSSIETPDVRAWTLPLWQLAEAREGSGAVVELPRLRFLWGKAWNVPAVVAALAERLENFDATGAARRSWLRMRLRCVPERDEAPEGAASGLPTNRIDLTNEHKLSSGAQRALLVGPSGELDAKADVADLLSDVLEGDAARELAEQATAAVCGAEEELAEAGHTIALDASVVLGGFSLSLSIDVDLSALTDNVVVSTIAGWLRWARDGIASLPAAAKRLGLGAIRALRAGLSTMIDRIGAAARRAAGALRERLEAVRLSLISAARHVGAIARSAYAELRKRVVSGYRALARRAAGALSWIEQHAAALTRAAASLARSARDALAGALDVFVASSRAVVSAVVEGAIDAARAAGRFVASRARDVAAVVRELGSHIPAALASAIHAAASARAAVVAWLREHGGSALRWAESALARGAQALEDAAQSAGRALVRAARFVGSAAASALEDVIGRVRAYLSAPRRAPLARSLASELLEASVGDDDAPSVERGGAARERASAIALDLRSIERGEPGSEARVPVVLASLSSLSSLALAEQDRSFTSLVEALDRPTALPLQAGRVRLDRLAFERYGDPRAWRLIALANDIDDPLAVAEGTPLIAPPAGALRTGAV